MKKRIVLIILVLTLSICLTACKSSDYKKAIELQGTGNYQAAADIFTQLADYEDSADHLAGCIAMMDAIDFFDNATVELENKNTALDEAISVANSLVQGEDKALDNSLRTSLETLISNAKAAKIAIPEMPETTEEINSLAASVLSTDYSDILSDLNNGQINLENSIKQYALVNNPSEAYVISCLKNVPGIMDISAATEDNDPNGQLGKAGGYTSAIYFSHENVNQSEVLGNTIIEKGTACGGQIEVYASENDALKRNDYLAGFDGTILASGSHKVIGTVLIRTSDMLTGSQQKELEANVINALIALE